MGMTRSRPTLLRDRCPRTLGLAGVLAFGCALPDKPLGELDDSTTSDGSTGDSQSQTSAASGDESTETGELPGDCVPGEVGPVPCGEDQDLDGVRLACDNAPEQFNPDQSDIDEDGIADVVDQCPLVAGATNTADSDRDGVGNDCDSCRQTLDLYNAHDNAIAVPDYLLVRNIRWQGDADQDGIGDVCDNCVQVPNCENFGPDNPYEIGDPIAFDDRNLCQRDDDGDLVGDACAGEVGVGIGPDDDFDGDLVLNQMDICPRQPAPAQACTGDDECPAGAQCAPTGVCNHVDVDADGVGDICDTCPFTPNPNQTMDGAMQEEDEDGDFVGNVCETNNACASLADARPFAFYEVAVNGECCTVQLVQDEAGNLHGALSQSPLLDLNGTPVRIDCSDEQEADGVCRRLPNSVAAAPSMLTPPAGCEQALADAGIDVAGNAKLGPDDVPSLDALWDHMCFLPQVDQDFDGLGDACDFCPFAFDPTNEVYVDENGMEWPGNGAYCNGDYDPENICSM